MSSEIHIPGYEILDELGAGGMAKVYLGIQTSLDRKVAIKILHAALSMQSDEFKQRFFHEGKILARVNHPNIVSIYDIGEANELLYMAMEYVPGGTLADRIKVQALTVDECIEICAQVGLALHTTHLEHVVHRDLKPSNVLMKDGVKPMLTDFGIARETDTEAGLTQTGHIVGTLQYMSPEQIRGLPVDHRSDIYSLGLLFYRLLTGRLPFVASSQYDLSRMQCEEPPPPLPPQLAEFQPIMDVILAKDPNDRFQTTLDFCKALQTLEVTDEDYRTELTQATRIYDSSRMPFQSYTGGGYSGPRSGPHSGSQSGSFARSRDISGPISARHGTESTAYRTGTQGYGQPQPPPRRSWLKPVLAIGLPVLALVSAAILYFAVWYKPSSGLNPDQQRRMDNFLQRVESHYDNLDIDTPPQENAVYYLKRALELSPNYQPALDWARKIAESYATDADLALEKGDIETAREKIEKGRAIDSSYAYLGELDKKISEMQADQKRQAEIKDTLSVAESYKAQGHLIEPASGNAFDAYNKVLKLDSVNQTALQGLADIERTLTEQLQALIKAGNMEEAGKRLPVIQSHFPDSAGLAQIQSEIGDQLRLAREGQQVNDYLATAQEQIQAGKLIEPENDNALASYKAVLTLRPDNAQALQGLDAIARSMAGTAKQALDNKEFQKAVQLADSGLLASPQDSELTSIRTQALGQLGAREREIQDLLQTAQGLVMSGHFLPPGDNALDTFRKVDSMDPGNPQAQRGLNQLPSNILDEINQLKIHASLQQADTLAEAAVKAYPKDDRFAQVRSELGDLLSQEQRREQRESLLAESASLIQTRPMTLDLIEKSATALEKVRKEFPGDVTATSQLGDLITAIADEAKTVSRGGNEDSGLVLLDKGLEYFSGNPELTNTRQELVQQRDQRMAAEKARIAAMTGKLAIDAIPWGEVVSIKGADGKAVNLPDQTATPLVVPLLEGKYTVSVKNDAGGPPVELQAVVVAQQVATTTAKFDSMTADDYFERSGW